MVKLQHLAAAAAALLGAASANVEKVIFLGPTKIPILQQSPTLSDLRLSTLTPDRFTQRTELERVFPGPEAPGGHVSWHILDELTEDQRYELRVCWAATEPTSFDMEVYDLDRVFQTPELMQSLAAYSMSRQGDRDVGNELLSQRSAPTGEQLRSVLLLRIAAAADYYTDDRELMANPPPVLVDLILDPFLWNVLPRSLLPTVFYIVGVAALSWIVAKFVTSQIRSITQGDKASQPQKKVQ